MPLEGEAWRGCEVHLYYRARERLGTVPGRRSNFFERLPAGASVYLPSFILHDWGDRDAIQILDQCAEAAGTDGRILIIERTNIDMKQSENLISMDLRMLIYFGGRESTLEEFKNLTPRVGLTVRRAPHGPSDFSVPECADNG